MECKKLTNVKFCKNLESIDQLAFCSTNIKNVDIPEKVNYLADYSFGDCKKLETVTLPNSLESIGGNRVFIECKRLKRITAPKHLKEDLSTCHCEIIFK